LLSSADFRHYDDAMPRRYASEGCRERYDTIFAAMPQRFQATMPLRYFHEAASPPDTLITPLFITLFSLIFDSR